MSNEGQNEPLKFCEIIQNNKFNDVADKFRAYRLNAEAAVIKLKETNTVNEQLKTEINIIRNVEKNLKGQITSAQNRLIHLQKNIKMILTVSERLRQNEKASFEIERKVGQIEETIQKIKEESQNLIKVTSNQLDLMKKYEEVKLELKNKESAIDLLKIENQTLSNEKQEMQMQNEHNYKVLQTDLEEIKREKMELQVQYDQTLRVYKKQIEDHELTINEYERERKSLLEEFAIPKTLESTSDIAWADSTVLIIPEDRSPKNSKFVKSSMDPQNDGENQVFSCSAHPQGNLSSARKPKLVNFKPNKGRKQKPQLEFLTSNTTQKTPLDDPPPKRRLFSMNCNHYAN